MSGYPTNSPALWLRCTLMILASVMLVVLGGGRMWAADAPADSAPGKEWIQVTPSCVLPVRVGERWGVLRPDGSTLLPPIYTHLELLDVADLKSWSIFVVRASNRWLKWPYAASNELDARTPWIRPTTFILASRPGLDAEAPPESAFFTVEGHRLLEFQGWDKRWIASKEILDRRIVPHPPFDPWAPEPAAGDGPSARLHLIPDAAYAGVEVMPVAHPDVPGAVPNSGDNPLMVIDLEQPSREVWRQSLGQMGRDRGIPDLDTYGCANLLPGDDTEPYLFVMLKRGRPIMLAHEKTKGMKVVSLEPYVGPVEGKRMVSLVGESAREVYLVASARYFAIAVDREVAIYSEACELLGKAELPPFIDMRFTRDGENVFVSTEKTEDQIVGRLLTPAGTLLEPRIFISDPPIAGVPANLDDLHGPAYIAQADSGVGLYRPDLQRWVVEPTATEIYRTADHQHYRVLNGDKTVRIVDAMGEVVFKGDASCTDYLPPAAPGTAPLVVLFDRDRDRSSYGTLRIGDGKPLKGHWRSGRIAAFSTRFLAIEERAKFFDRRVFPLHIYDRERGEWLEFVPTTAVRVSPEILYVYEYTGKRQLYLMPDGSRIPAFRDAPEQAVP